MMWMPNLTPIPMAMVIPPTVFPWLLMSPEMGLEEPVVFPWKLLTTHRSEEAVGPSTLIPHPAQHLSELPTTFMLDLIKPIRVH